MSKVRTADRFASEELAALRAEFRLAAAGSRVEVSFARYRPDPEVVRVTTHTRDDNCRPAWGRREPVLESIRRRVADGAGAGWTVDLGQWQAVLQDGSVETLCVYGPAGQVAQYLDLARRAGQLILTSDSSADGGRPDVRSVHPDAVDGRDVPAPAQRYSPAGFWTAHVTRSLGRHPAAEAQTGFRLESGEFVPTVKLSRHDPFIASALAIAAITGSAVPPNGRGSKPTRSSQQPSKRLESLVGLFKDVNAFVKATAETFGGIIGCSESNIKETQHAWDLVKYLQQQEEARTDGKGPRTEPYSWPPLGHGAPPFPVAPPNRKGLSAADRFRWLARLLADQGAFIRAKAPVYAKILDCDVSTVKNSASMVIIESLREHTIEVTREHYDRHPVKPRTRSRKTYTD